MGIGKSVASGRLAVSGLRQAHGETPHPGHRCVLQRLSSFLAVLAFGTYYCAYFCLTDVALKYRVALGFYVTVL